MGEKAIERGVKENNFMLTEFMRSCTPVLPEEKDDYNVILQEIENNKDPFIGFMPAIIEDLWPIYVMEDTDARKFNLHLGDSIYRLFRHDGGLKLA